MTATKSQTQEHNTLTSHFRTSVLKRKALEEAREKKQMTYQGVKNNNQSCGFCRELLPHGSGREWLETINTKETNPINIEILYFLNLLYERERQSGMVAHIYKSIIISPREEGCKFEVSLSYTASSEPAWETW